MRRVVYLADESIDITDEVLERLKIEAKTPETKEPRALSQFLFSPPSITRTHSS